MGVEAFAKKTVKWLASADEEGMTACPVRRIKRG
jgi:hypothetical protein